MTAKRAEVLVCVLSIALTLALSGCATTKRDWQDANRLGTVEAYEQFLQKHPHAEQANDARRLLPELRADRDWSKAEATNTIGAYEKFLSMHPQSRHERQANAALEALRFGQAKASDSIVDYETYLKHHPDASRAEDAQRRLRALRYADARQRRTVAAFESFLARYSGGADVDTLRAELPAIQVIEQAWETARQNKTINSYKDYLAKYPEEDHAEEAKARIQIHAFNSGFGMAGDFTEEQIGTYIQQLRNETYSTIIQEPTEIEYYVVTGPRHTVPTKKKVIVRLSPSTKACSLNLEAGNLSVTALYVDTQPPVTRALFQRKWGHTMVHTGFAGPGLEIDLPSPRREEFKRFLDAFSIYYRVMYSTSGGILGYVIPDLVRGSDHDGTPYPHLGKSFTIEHEDRPIVIKVDGVKGMPIETITTYRQALALKTYLTIVGNK